MRVTLAKSAGFCFGVKRAVDKVYEEAGRSHAPVYTYGPIIHNEEVVRDLEKRGVHAVCDESELSELSGGIMVIRSHGVSRRLMTKYGSLDFKL